MVLMFFDKTSTAHSVSVIIAPVLNMAINVDKSAHFNFQLSHQSTSPLGFVYNQTKQKTIKSSTPSVSKKKKKNTIQMSVIHQPPHVILNMQCFRFISMKSYHCEPGIYTRLRSVGGYLYIQ